VSEQGRAGRTTGEGRLLTGTFLALFVAALAFFMAGGVVLPVAARFAEGPLDLDGIGVGVGIGAFSVAALLMRPVVGWAADRFGRRPLLLTGGLLTVVALVAHVAVDSLVGFVAVRALLGVAEALFFVAALAAISDLAPSHRSGEAMNLGSLAVYIGLGLGPVIGETVLGVGGFATAWLVAAGIAAAATVLTLLVTETAPSALAPKGTRARTRVQLIHPAGLLPGFLILTGTWGMAGFFAFIPLHADAVGLDGAGALLAIYAAIVIVLRVVFAKLPDQLGAVRVSGSALTVIGIGLLAMGLVGGPVGLYAGTVVFALGVAFMFPALMAVAVARAAPSERGAVVGTTSVFFDLSFGLGPASLGILAGGGGYGGAFVASGVLALVGAAILVLLREQLRPPATAATVPAPPTLAA
jgi:MFS family permease